MLKITQAKLHKRLCRPTHFHFKETPLPPSQPTASLSQTLTTCQHPIHYTQSGEPMRCYKCNSLSHIKWNCQLYVCPLCRQRQPGHAQKNCPDHYHNDGTRGYFDIEGVINSFLLHMCTPCFHLFFFIYDRHAFTLRQTCLLSMFTLLFTLCFTCVHLKANTFLYLFKPAVRQLYSLAFH